MMDWDMYTILWNNKGIKIDEYFKIHIVWYMWWYNGLPSSRMYPPITTTWWNDNQGTWFEWILSLRYYGYHYCRNIYHLRLWLIRIWLSLLVAMYVLIIMLILFWFYVFLSFFFFLLFLFLLFLFFWGLPQIKNVFHFRFRMMWFVAHYKDFY